MKFKDYYEIMGVARDASQDEIKRAYRRLARKYHPDVSREADAEVRFKEVGEAYEVLKDPEKRAAYDRFGKDWKAGQDFRPPPDWNERFDFGGGGFTGASGFSDFFESLFGRGAAGGGAGAGFGAGPRGGFRMAGEDQHARISITLEEAYAGTARTLTLRALEAGERGAVQMRERSLNVRIPKGVVEGQRIRLAGQGGGGVGGGPAGDLYLTVDFVPHRRFRAERRDVYLDLPLAPWEAALGATIAVPTLGGSVELRIPRGSQAGQKLRLKGRGLPGQPPGDQYVVLRIVAPRADSREAEELYRKMAETMRFDPRAELEP